MMADDLEVSPQDIAEFVEKVTKSGVFGRSKRRTRLLEHIIISEIDGQGDRLKAYAIGLDVFNKTPEFDPSNDSVVRVEMGRLRTDLALFESSEFADTRIMVEIPVGTYRPQIRLRPPSGKIDPPAPPQPRAPAAWRTKASAIAAFAMVALLALNAANIGRFMGFTTPQAERPIIGVQINPVEGPKKASRSTEAILDYALARSKIITVFKPHSNSRYNADATFEIDTQIFQKNDTTRLILGLKETATQRIIWGTSEDVPKGTDVSDVLEQKIVGELGDRIINASKSLLRDMDPKDLPPEALYVLASWFSGSDISGITSNEERLNYALMALNADPEHGPSHSAAAEKMSFLANFVKAFDTPEIHRKAQWHSQKALDLAASDPEALFSVGTYLWNSGRMEESRNVMSRVLELNSRHILASVSKIADSHFCTKASDEVLQDAIEFDQNLSADHPTRWFTLSVISALHVSRGEWELALEMEDRASRINTVPYTFMRHAMILDQLGQSDKAVALVERRLAHTWAGFEPEHFVKVAIPRLCGKRSQAAEKQAHYDQLLAKLTQ